MFKNSQQRGTYAFVASLLLLLILALGDSDWLHVLNPDEGTVTPLPRTLRIPVRRVPVDRNSPHAVARRAFVASSFFGGDATTRAPPSVATTLQRRRLLMDMGGGSMGAVSATADFSSGPSLTADSSTAGSSVVPPTPTPAAAGPPGRVHLRDYSDYMYIGVIGVGTPAQYFGCVFDTGSADTWVFSSAVPAPRPSWLHYFDSSLSSSFHPVQRAWSIRYGKGTASGLVSTDTLWVGGLEVPGQDVAFTTDTGQDAENTFAHSNEPIDGLFGLGFQQLTTKGFGTAVMEHAKNVGAISEKVFSFHMASSDTDPVAILSSSSSAADSPPDEVASSSADESLHPESFFLLGGADPTLAPHGLTYVPIIVPTDVEGRWVVEMGGMGIDGGEVRSFCSKTSGATKHCFAWIDTGSSFILLPEDRFVDIMTAIIKQRPDCSISTPQGKSIDRKVTCTITATYYLLPNLSFRFGDVDFLLTPAEYVLQGADDDGKELLLLGFSPRRNSHQADYDEIIIGDTFLKNYYTVFDMERYQIGFANRPAAHVLTWWLALAVGAATLALMSACMYCVHRKHAGRVEAQAVHAPSDAGEGEAHPRGYAQVNTVASQHDPDAEFGRHSSNGNGNGSSSNGSNGDDIAPTPAPHSYDPASPSSRTTSSVAQTGDTRPRSPSREKLTAEAAPSEDDMLAMEQL